MKKKISIVKAIGNFLQLLTIFQKHYFKKHIFKYLGPNTQIIQDSRYTFMIAMDFKIAIKIYDKIIQ